MPNQFDPPKSLIFLTNRIGRMMANIIHRKLSPEHHSLKSANIGILADLWQHDGVRQQDLVISNIKDKGTIARALSQMEQANIVLRVPDKNDKRSKLIYLTHKGKQLQHEIMPLAIETQKEITKNIDPAELNICLKVLSQIYKNLGYSCKHNEINNQ